jgi:hypothetical protein
VRIIINLYEYEALCTFSFWKVFLQYHQQSEAVHWYLCWSPSQNNLLFTSKVFELVWICRGSQKNLWVWYHVRLPHSTNVKHYPWLHPSFLPQTLGFKSCCKHSKRLLVQIGFSLFELFKLPSRPFLSFKSFLLLLYSKWEIFFGKLWIFLIDQRYSLLHQGLI